MTTTDGNKPHAKNAATNGFCLSSEFWTQFVQDHWEKSPVVLKKPIANPMATLGDVFQGIVKASELFRGEEVHSHLRFFVGHALLAAEIREHLPQARDKTIGGYVKRVSQMLNGQRFGFVAVEFPAFDVQTWFRLREFVRPLYDLVGIPRIPSQAGVFLGTYDKTPFGIHKDPHGTFVFVIEGRKRFHAWPREFFPDEQDISGTLNYERYLHGAVTLEGEPGDILYWPSTYWHVGEAVSSMTLSISLAITPSSLSSPDSSIWRHAIRRATERLAAADGAEKCAFFPNSLQPDVKEIPTMVQRATRTLKKASRERSLDNALEVLWLNHVSSLGLGIVPPPSPGEKLADDAVVRGDLPYPIVWLPAEDDEIICSANGHSFSVGAHPHVLKLIERLNSGVASRVGNLMEEYSGTTSANGVEFEAFPEDVRALLEKLCSLRAITVVGRQNGS